MPAFSGHFYTQEFSAEELPYYIKKSLISSLIKETEIFPCDKAELPLKSILFNFTVYKDGVDVCEFLRDSSLSKYMDLNCLLAVICFKGGNLRITPSTAAIAR